MLEVDMLDLHILDVGMLEVHLQKGLKSVEAEQVCHLPQLVNSESQVIWQVQLGPRAEHSAGRILTELEEWAWTRSA
jgi:hypothetical protein